MGAVVVKRFKLLMDKLCVSENTGMKPNFGVNNENDGIIHFVIFYLDISVKVY